MKNQSGVDFAVKMVVYIKENCQSEVIEACATMCTEECLLVVPENWQNGDCLVCHDSVSVHTTLSAQTFMAKNKMPVIP
jgi:hypothetical protein